ncbi:MAG: hypothetical protein LM570_00025 [Thermocrinis sp.]|nr:hypothetical protein [Thermocrinis sp.]
MQRLILLTTLFMLLSISLFEGLIIILTAYTFYSIARGGLKPYGKLFFPLLLYAIPTLLSTILYTPSHLGKGIERSLFLLVYPLGGKEKLRYEFFKKFNLFLIMAGVLLIPVVIYKFLKIGEPAPLWGGWFEVGLLYSFFSLSAFAMLLYTKRIYYFLLYLLLFLLFVGFVFFSMRRSAMLGLVITLIFLLYLLRGFVSKKVLAFVLLSFTFASSSTFGILVEKDHRFAIAWELITGKRALDDQALNSISSLRWEIFKRGLEVLQKDIKEKNYLELLIGHGINSGYYLEPKSPVGGTYESVFLLSEPIEKGVLGLAGILWLWFAYYSFFFRFKIRQREDLLLLPSLSFLSVLLIGSIFTGFWDAMLPWILIMFRVVERHGEGH